MALNGIKVLELAGLAPSPYCGMILSDFGADVIRINKVRTKFDIDTLARGKRSIAIDLKKKEGVNVIRKMSRQADVLIEPFRAGVMESLGLGPEVLMKENQRLIYARITGYGQKGPLSKRAGHDINYLAISGLLSTIGRAGERPIPPVNYLADFAGGGLMCAFGIVTALMERSQSGQGQVIDTNMVEGAAYIGSFAWRSRDLPLWNNPRGENILDTGAHYYNTYQTSDGKYMAVGAIEPQFYAIFVQGLGLTPDELPQSVDREEGLKRVSEIFSTKKQAEWTEIFENTDACVTPVIEWDDAHNHRHNRERAAFMPSDMGGRMDPIPAPRLERTPASQTIRHQPQSGQHSMEVMREFGFDDDEISKLIQLGAVEQLNGSKL